MRDGYRADWEDRGSRLALYAPSVGGYRLLVAWLELHTYQPAWGTRAHTVTEWRAYRYDSTNAPVSLGERDCESFDSAVEIAAWLESIALA